MARATAISVENNFIKGLITEVTGVNSPENSVVETLDVIYDRQGKARTREGFLLESATAASILEDGVVSEYLWETVSDTSTKTFVVVQIGSRVYFFESDGQNDLVSGLHPTSMDLLTLKSSRFTNLQIAETPASFSAGAGFLFISHPMCKTFRVE